MKLWLDDIREPPDSGFGWIWVKTYKEFEQQIRLSSRVFNEISLDHDLGTEKTGHDVLIFLESYYEECGKPPYNPLSPDLKITCHSMNPVGREKIEAGIRRLHEKGYLK